jgi:hypothetical protein
MGKSKRFAPKRMLALAPVVGLVVLGVAGCTAKGGGYIGSATGADKATFGFTWQKTKTQNVLRGSWHDGYVKFRLDRDLGIQGTYPYCVGGPGHYVSTSRSNPGGGTLQLSICDEGEPGPTQGDTISINVTSGPYAGYSNGGTLEGGNLQVLDK